MKEVFLKKLILKNFKKIQDLTVEFTDKIPLSVVEMAQERQRFKMRSCGCYLGRTARIGLIPTLTLKRWEKMENQSYTLYIA